MIEAQSKFITGQIGEVLAARSEGKTLAITPRDARVAEFNEEIQRELENSSFADPNCNSWYKRKDNGRITQNWSRNVVDYQKVGCVRLGVPRVKPYADFCARFSVRSTGVTMTWKVAELRP